MLSKPAEDKYGHAICSTALGYVLTEEGSRRMSVSDGSTRVAVSYWSGSGSSIWKVKIESFTLHLVIGVIGELQPGDSSYTHATSFGWCANGYDPTHGMNR